MGKRVRETERKYEAAGRVGEPDLTGLPGVARVRTLDPVGLDAVYFDAPGLPLATRGITLRRRTGGDDAGWHLKLPAVEADTRTEVRFPLGRVTRTVPPAVAAEVAVYTRGAGLLPVARLKNDRRRVHLLNEAGEPLAEIAHDHVTAQVFDEPAVRIDGWTETEVELAAGDPALLDAVEARLADAGLRRSASPSKLARALGERLTSLPPPPRPPADLSTAGEAVLAYLHEQVAAITALDPEVRRDEPDAVHRMRVATRRLRSALRSFRRELDRGATNPIGEELRWLAGLLGLERDREVLARRLEERLSDLEPQLVTDTLRARLREDADRGHTAARSALLRELEGAAAGTGADAATTGSDRGGGGGNGVGVAQGRGRYIELLERIDLLLAAPPYLEGASASAPDALRRAVRRDHKRLRKRVRRALALPPGTERDVALHEARKAAKRARYSAEVAQPVLGKAAAGQRARMTAVQKVLGEHQDSVMARAALARLARQAALAGEDVLAYGLLEQAERRRAAKVERSLAAVWRKADRKL